MRIQRIKTSPVASDERPYACLEICDDGGNRGIGEFTPWPPAPLADVESMAVDLVTALLGLGPFEWDERDPLGFVSRLLASDEHVCALPPSVRFAAETALLDLVGQRLGKTLAACLSGYEPHAEVPCNALLDASVDVLPVRARELEALGYVAIKVKLRARDDVGFAAEVEALREMRRVWRGELRLDPNGRWSIDEAHRNMAILAEFQPRYVEQPVPADQLTALGKTACPWAADESLLLPGLPEQIAQPGTCSAFILKPALLGGLSKARDLANLASSAGIDVITTHALDGPVSIAAACEFARSLPGSSLACGLDLHAGLGRYPSMKSPHHVCSGVIGRSNALPGLGFSEQDRKQWMA